MAPDDAITSACWPLCWHWRVEVQGAGWRGLDGRGELLPALQRLFERCSAYFELETGRQARAEEAVRSLEELPDGRGQTDKAFLALVQHDEVIGALDLVSGFRREGEAYLGLLLLEPAVRRQGLGRDVMAAERGRQAVLECHGLPPRQGVSAEAKG